MGVIRKIVSSLLLVATLAHGQLSVDLNGQDITDPLQHQGEIEQPYPPRNIDRTYGGAPRNHLAHLDENIEIIYVSPEGRSWTSLSFSEFFNGILYVIQIISILTIGSFFGKNWVQIGLTVLIWLYD